VGLKDRILRAERRAGIDKESACEVCNGVIITEEIDENGVSTYPGREPCPVCDSKGADGWIGRIVVDMRDPEDRPEEEEGFTFKLDRPGHYEESEVMEWPKQRL
jgi:RNA polymerase subunit RPABC4/transcription elongation factor Spt4